MDLWNEIVTAATVGTERRPFAPPAERGALADVLKRIDVADSEGALLSAAAATALYRRAGRAAQRDERLPVAECPPDDRPMAGPRAAARLASMLGGNHRAALPEWLLELAKAGRRAPVSLLPELLDLGRVQSDLREAIAAVAGARGRWLAEQNTDWAYAMHGRSDANADHDAAQLQAEWETGVRAARLALLQELRAERPAQARELVASTWTSEKADDRAAFLATFAIRLCMDDEPFLEDALDDRGKDVRRNAADLLTRLPESRLAGRMLGRARPLLTWVPAEKSRMLGLRPGQPARIDVTLPEECDTAMVRDGIEPKPPSYRKDLGERAWWLSQIVSAIPPAAWSGLWGAAPAELLQAAAKSEWSTLLLEAWAAATIAFRDADWAVELLRADQTRTGLLGVVEPAEQALFLQSLFQSERASLHKHPALALLRQHRHPWSADLTRTVLRALQHYLRAAGDPQDYQLRGALAEDFGLFLPPALLDEVLAALPAGDAAPERWRGAIDKLLITLQFRRDMLNELREL